MQNLFHKIWPLLLQNYDVGKELVFDMIKDGYVPLRVTSADGHQSDSADRVLTIRSGLIWVR
jgi:hypothetical protein